MNNISNIIKKNFVIVLLLAFVVGGYVFFFLSPRIFKEGKENLMNTEFSTYVNAGSNYAVAVEDWIYSESEHSMEVILSFQHKGNNPSELIEYAAMSRNSSRDSKAVKCECTYQSPNLATVILNDVPKDFNEMGIKVRFFNKHLSLEDSLSATTSSSQPEFTEESVVVYTNIYTVTITESVQNVDVIQLYSDKIKREIDSLEKENTTILAEIQEMKTQQRDILERVSELRANEKYLTESELKKNQSDISSYQSTYDLLTSQIKTKNEKISENSTMIDKNNQKIRELILMKKGAYGYGEEKETD